MGTRLMRGSGLFGALTALVIVGSGGREALADPIYQITNLGVLPGTSQSVATAINASGQIAGVSYNSSDGTWHGNGLSYDAGAQSFLYSNGQMSRINPVDGPANAINDSGQVVGGHYSSINDAGQYVGSNGGGLEYKFQSFSDQLVSGGTVTVPPILPVAINNSGAIGGISSSGAAAILQNGHVTDVFSPTGPGDVNEVSAISNSGYAIINQGIIGKSEQYWLYNPTGYHFNGETGPNYTLLNPIPGGAGNIALGLNDLGQVVGNDFLYTNGEFLSLQKLLPPIDSGHWSNLVALGINDQGEIVGQGLYDGQERAFLMTPDPVPEPSTILIFGLMASAVALRPAISRRRFFRNAKTAS